MDAHSLSTAALLEFPDTEQRLLARVRQRDQLAFQQLYQRHLGAVYGQCLRLTGQASQAEDVTQEVFLLLWRKIDSFQGDSAFSTWLHALTANTALSYLRRQKSWWQRLYDTDDYPQLAEQLEASDAPPLDDLQQAMARLPDRARLVFVLHAIEGYRQEAIATSLGISVGTVKAQYHRARQLLEQQLGLNSGDST